MALSIRLLNDIKQAIKQLNKTPIDDLNIQDPAGFQDWLAPHLNPKQLPMSLLLKADQVVFVRPLRDLTFALLNLKNQSM
jgi:hypothetical protein